MLFEPDYSKMPLFFLTDGWGTSMAKLGLLKEFWDFLKVRKKWWLTPIMVVLVLLGSLIVFTQSSVVAPFIYTLF